MHRCIIHKYYTTLVEKLTKLFVFVRIDVQNSYNFEVFQQCTYSYNTERGGGGYDLMLYTCIIRMNRAAPYNNVKR